MTLFAYHRDPVRVAQELNLNVAQLQTRVDELGLRRRISTILDRTTDIDMFQPQHFAPTGPTRAPTPLVRRRRERDEAEKVEESIEAKGQEESSVSEERTQAESEAAVKADDFAARQEPALTERPRSRKEADRLNPRREYVRQAPKQRRAQAKKARPQREPEVEVVKEASREPIESLFHPMGKTVVESFIEQEKANVRMLVAKLAEDFVGAGGGELQESDLWALLEHHELVESFREKELTNTRFLMGFHQGARLKLANALGLSQEELEQHLELHGLSQELEQLRADRARLELGKSRLRDRFMQVLTRAPYLDDLGVLPVIDREVEELLRGFYAQRKADAEGSAERLDEMVLEETGLQKNQFAKLLRRYSMSEHASEVLKRR